MDKSQEKLLVRWLKAQKYACGRFLALSIILGLATGIATIAQAWVIASVLHSVIIESASANSFTYYYMAFAGLIGLRSLLSYAREMTSFEAGAQLRQHIRKLVMDKLTRLGPAYIKGKPAGSWASIVLEQVEDLHDFYARYLPQMSLAAVIPLLILVVVFPINWAGGLILLATAPLIPLFMVLVGMGAADANRKNFDALARLSGHFMDRLKGMATIKLFHRGEAETKQIAKASDEFRERTMTVLRLAFLSSAVLEFFAAVSIAVLAVYFGFSYLDHLDFGHYGVKVSLFTGLFVLILAPEFFQPLRDMGTHYHAKAQAVGAAEALSELLAHPEPSQDAEQRPAQESDKRLSSPLLPIREIQAKDFCVQSLDGQTLVGPLNFSLDWQQKLAIIGPSGAGKTSLLNGLLGFLPYQGSLALIDEQGNSHELKLVDIAQWRAQLAWLGQNPELFHASIGDNVRMGRDYLGDDQVMELLKRAKADHFVMNLPKQLETLVGEQGSNLSVGQAQRIALARAYAQQANFYILDEPSASLDADSERLVTASLHQAMTHATGIMVTHRLDQLERMGKVMVLQRGSISQMGSYQELLEQKEGWLVQALLANSSVSGQKALAGSLDRLPNTEDSERESVDRSSVNPFAHNDKENNA